MLHAMYRIRSIKNKGRDLEFISLGQIEKVGQLLKDNPNATNNEIMEVLKK